jgi:hypothetical protein
VVKDSPTANVILRSDLYHKRHIWLNSALSQRRFSTGPTDHMSLAADHPAQKMATCSICDRSLHANLTPTKYQSHMDTHDASRASIKSYWLCCEHRLNTTALEGHLRLSPQCIGKASKVQGTRRNKLQVDYTPRNLLPAVGKTSLASFSAAESDNVPPVVSVILCIE